MENVKYSYGKTHELKTWPSFFNAILNRQKTFEVRKNDRLFQLGDTLLLKEFDPNTETYTGACITKRIGYILGGGQFGIESGFVVIGFDSFF